MSIESTTEVNKPQERSYSLGTVERKLRGDKFSSEVNESFVVTSDLGAKINIKDSTMLELAVQDSKGISFTQLIRNGYEGSGKMASGAGIAVKVSKTSTSYDCVFYTGELGKSFEPSKITRRDYVRLDKKHLGALFTFLLCNDEVVKTKAEALKVERASLSLD